MTENNRIKKLQSILIGPNAPVDAILIQSAENRRYYCGFTGTFGYLLVSRDDAWFLTDSRYTEQARMETAPIHQVALERYTPATSIRLLAEAYDLEAIGFEGNRMTYDMYFNLTRHFGRANLVDLSKEIDGFRRIKDAEEIETLRQAEAIGDAAFAHVCTLLHPGITEREVALELAFFMQRHGATGLSFDTIVASGVRSALPHGVASDKKIEKGDLVVMDFGCVYHGYCSDMTRTVAVGDPGEEMRNLYNLVLDAQLTALSVVRSDVVGKDVHQVAVDYFERVGMAAYFGHGLGHSVGLNIHEFPTFSPASQDVIPSGTVITVEPGLYIPGKGGVRIEDLIVVRDDGYENLTQSPKELLIL